MPFWRMPTIVCAAVLLAACAGDTRDSLSNNGGSTHYELVTVGPSVAGAITFSGGAQSVGLERLVAVDVANPTSAPVQVEPAGTAWVMGSFSAASTGGTGQSAPTRHTVYVKEGGIYRVDHDVAKGAAPKVQRISTLNTTAICARSIDPVALLEGDAVTPGASWLFIDGPGPDGTCFTADDTQFAIRLDAAATTAPRVLTTRVRTALRDSAGAITGFLATNATQALRLDLAFAGSPLFALTAAIEDRRVEFTPGFPGLWSRIENGVLHVVNLASPATTVPVVTLRAGEAVSQIASDGTQVFVLVGTTTTGRLLAFSAAAPAAATELTTVNSRVESLAWTPTRVVIVTASAVVSVPKSGGAQTPVMGVAPGETLGFALGLGENVWAEVRMPPLGGGAPRSRVDVVASDGTNSFTFADTQLVAAQFRGSVPLVRASSAAVAYLASPASADSVAGATLRSIDGATRAPLLTYGVLPAAPAGALFPATFSLYGEVLFFNYSGGGSSDLYVVDSDVGASWKRVTNLLAP